VHNNTVSTSSRHNRGHLPFLLLALAAIIVLASPACSSTPPGLGPAQACHENSDCASGLICTLGACRAQCATAADCLAGGTCVDNGDEAVCQYASENNSTCTKESDCSPPLACASDYRCRNLCTMAADCDALGIKGRVCAMDANGVLYCADPSEVSNGTIVVAAPPGAPDTGVMEPPDATVATILDGATATNDGLNETTDAAALDAYFDVAIALDVQSLDANLDVARPLDAPSLDSADLTPTVISTTPANGAAGVSIAERLTAALSEPMAPATINAATFTLQQGTTLIRGAVSYSGTIGTFIPSSDLAVNTSYTATITTGAKDVAGTPMASPYTWIFTTGACGQAPVVLGAADSFAALAGSTVTSTGPTSVTGDLGVSPGTAVTGFPPGTIVGAQHAGDPTAALGIADLITAYNDAAGRTLCAITVAGNLGGQTLTPGLYKSTSSLAISAGDLTLDAQGDPNGVFIFQMASTLTTTSGRQVILSGAAKSTNVYWQVGTSATIGTTSVLQGTIMADQTISLDTGATLSGRALARIAAVTLDSNTIVKPAP
jgi:hypothetical protein